MYINSFACKTGPTVISNEFLTSLGEAVDVSKHSITERRSILKPEYIQEFQNADPSKARHNCVLSSVDLAAEAARLAMQRANIDPSEIGLLIADTTTPNELIPSEGQRIARVLEIRIPAFDIGTGGVGMPSLLNSIKDWKEERLAKPVLCISVHTPTLSVDYRSGLAREIFGDAAFACVVSNKKEGFSLLSTLQSVMPEPDRLSIPITGLIDLKADFLASVKDLLATSVAELPGFSKESGIDLLASTYGVEPDFVTKGTASDCGESLGATTGVLIESVQDSLSSGSKIAVSNIAVGRQMGSMLVEKL